MAMSFDFDAARRERDARFDPPTIVVAGMDYTLPPAMPAAVNLELIGRDRDEVMRVDEAVRILKLLFPAEAVDGWLDDGWTDLDIFHLTNTALHLVRGVPLTSEGVPATDSDDGEEDGDEGEAPGPDSGPDSSSKGSPRSKPTSPATTASTSRTRTRSRS